MNTLKKEFPYLFIALIPFAYMAYLWDKLPETIPMHWNAKGEIDGWGNKTELFWLLLFVVGFFYILFLILPKIDPKQKLQTMGRKLNVLRLIVSIFTSGLAIFILYGTQVETLSPVFIFAFIGLVFACLGNYFKTIKPNYFIGIRTPWTLESEEVWKKTHTFGGKIWLAGGLLIFALSFITNPESAVYILLGIVLAVALIPVLYSYFIFRKLKKTSL